MEKKAWAAWQSCNQKRYRTSDDESMDRLSQLPDEILLSILSSFTMKEAARVSVLSHKWNYLWQCFPTILAFEDESARKRISRSFCDPNIIDHERPCFVRWVNQVVEGHLGTSIDELKIEFDLDKSYQYHVDKWVVFAFTKHVRKLELKFTPAVSTTMSVERCTLPLECCSVAIDLPRNFCTIKPPLTSLCLSYVNITEQVVEYLLNSCPSLENLEIRVSKYLTSLKVSGSLRLKHLKLCNCRKLEIVDISAPKLLSFSHFGPPADLHIRNASLLSKISVGGRISDLVMPAFDSISEQLPQLECLALKMCLYLELNLGMNHCPTLKNLKHLKLDVTARFDQSLFGWIPLIEASPALQKLTFKLYCPVRNPLVPIRKDTSTRLPIKCLETLEIIGFVGTRIDILFATYVIENAVMLKEVIVDFVRHAHLSKGLDLTSPPRRLIELERIIPQGVRLIVKPLDI